MANLDRAMDDIQRVRELADTLDALAQLQSTLIVAAEAEFRRRLLNLSERELAALVGLSQGKYANAYVARSDLSRVSKRLGDVLL
jgi:hypothetical protein